SLPFGVGCRLSGLKGNETRMNASSETCPHLVVEAQPPGACSPRRRAKRPASRTGARGAGTARGRAQAAGGRHMMNRRAFLATLGVGIVATPPMGEAQQASRVWRIGVLELMVFESAFAAFREGLRALGYSEGHNILIESRSAKSEQELPDLAAELVRTKA